MANRSFYQLILLGDTSNHACGAICSRFFELLKARGLDASLVSVLDAALVLAAPGTGGYESYKPSFAFYFGRIGHRNRDIAAIEKLMGNGDAIFPICFAADRYKEEMPAILHPVNGRVYKEVDLDSIVNVAFEELRLLRKKRRVFISYKRSDSSAVANQLFDVLSRHQFDVFMDTYSIRGAADFQAELHHRITDSDVLIQLNSPSFMDSDWCKDEISEANARQVGVLQVNWPNVDAGDANQLSVVKKLMDIDFRRRRYQGNGSTLRKDVLEEIAGMVEAVRARNIAARQDGLTAEFVKEAERQGRIVVKEPMFLVEMRADGTFWYYIPAIGVPQSMDCYESLEMLMKWMPAGVKPAKVHLIYDDMRILPKWIAHLDWMNKSLEVKIIKKQKFETWLKLTR